MIRATLLHKVTVKDDPQWAVEHCLWKLSKPVGSFDPMTGDFGVTDYVVSSHAQFHGSVANETGVFPAFLAMDRSNAVRDYGGIAISRFGGMMVKVGGKGHVSAMERAGYKPDRVP